ncbi:Eco57I restriction-modification methylase domain-containing protein [Fervidobacterium thailandense]|uniref:site-specific DNA-methyltransferase (adenine-specific) n=1 Tax=Fervidobacterium thailandense TaxID=1008305 RepID=A0A1E3G2S8_9BACT|nr:N-6 DNA methylase [Fervidobacterium thailandense]ODN30537.1 hypothetical protein A4H02_04605 [Fervidobacterium thailandense]
MGSSAPADIVGEILKELAFNYSNERLAKFLSLKAKNFYETNEPSPEYDDENFKNGRFIGEIRLSQVERLVVYSFETTRALSERSSRKLQFEKGKKILKDTASDAGIFVFYDTARRFRFSLITVEYVGAKRRFSPYKRFTYFVSPDETNKTFIRRLSEADFSSIDALKEAFSVDKVTKEFYQELANWYFWALKVVRFPPDAESEPGGRNVALIRLVTRLMFVWFMREKGIVRKELFDKKFLEKVLVDLSDNESTYYKAILQNLFFATLNTPRDKRRFRREERFKNYINGDYMNHSRYRYHELFKDPEQIVELFNDIPFLNGGLFECLDKRKDDESNELGREVRIDGFSDVPSKQPYVPNFLFFSDEREVDLNDDYGTRNKKYKVRGLINILNSYNFTIDENTPVDEEVALDPELLGKVFENLLASYNPETSETARKATGSYYTPREIVDFMVRTSLKEYLISKVPEIDPEKLDELFSYGSDDNPFDEETTERLIRAINELKVLDPAVGSGAFLMGMLHTLVHVLHKLDPGNERWKAEQLKVASKISDPRLRQRVIKEIEESFEDNELDYGRKLYLIQNCLYGVDIQPIAIQIAKLRFFISLLVDEKIDRTKENFGIQPLPNLETKLIAADSLIPLTVGNQLAMKDPEIIKLEEQLMEVREQYFSATLPSEKEKLKKMDKELRSKLVELMEQRNVFSPASAKKLAKWDPYETNKAAEWFDPEWMFGVRDGFDIVIGNPPYIQLQKNGGALAERYKGIGYETFDRMGDVYVLFYERGINLLKEGGHLCYITSNKWMRAGYGEKLRKYLLKFNPKLLVDLGSEVFESATVNTCVLLVQKSANERKTVGVTLERERDVVIEEQLTRKGVLLDKLTKEVWFIGDNRERKLKEKIESVGKPLRDWNVTIYRGVVTGLNEAFIIDSVKREEILRACKTEEERRRTEELLKPVLRGRDIGRYYYEWKGLWLIYIPWHFPLHEDKQIEGASAEAEALFSQQFPALYKYLLNYRAQLLARNKEETGIRYEWYALQRCAASYKEEFEKEKLVWTPVDSEYKFTVLPARIYFPNSVFMITGCPLYSWCGIFNSKLIRKYLSFLLSHESEYTYGSKKVISNVPIPFIREHRGSVYSEIEELVKEVLKAKQADKNANTIDFEKEIDSLVYKLYELTDEEIALVEKMAGK